MTLTLSVLDRPYSVFVSSDQPMDFTLFFRPFTVSSWLLICIMGTIVLSSLYLASLAAKCCMRRKIVEKDNPRISWKIIVLTSKKSHKNRY